MTHENGAGHVDHFFRHGIQHLNNSDLLSFFRKVLRRFTADASAADNHYLFPCFLPVQNLFGVYGTGKSGYGQCGRKHAGGTDYGIRLQLQDLLRGYLLIQMDIHVLNFQLVLQIGNQWRHILFMGRCGGIEDLPSDFIRFFIKGNLVAPDCGYSGGFHTCYSASHNDDLLRLLCGRNRIVIIPVSKHRIA